MTDSLRLYLTKAEESLQGAESKFAQGRDNNVANRCDYACFQAVVAALHHASVAPRGGRSRWGHALMQAECVGRLIHRRQLYCTSLRQVLGRNLTLRHTADYAPDMLTQTQAARALQRTQDFLNYNPGHAEATAAPRSRKTLRPPAARSIPRQDVPSRCSR
jgi:uncharacterized protein (UPF0332 family)